MTPALLVLALQAAPAPQRPTVVTPPPTTQPAAPVATPPTPAPSDPPAASPTIPPAPATPPQPYNYPETATPTPPAPQAPLSSPPAIPPPNQPFNYPPTESAAQVPDDVKFRRLVFAAIVTVNFHIFMGVPSGDFQFFLGTNLRPRKRIGGGQWNTAVGYQLGLSVGLADLPTLEFSSEDPNSDGFEFNLPLFYHRHHITAMGHGGKRGRLFYSFGGGALIWQTTPFAVEGEGKLGYVFSVQEGRRAKGVLGGQARLGAGFGGIPLPQFGLFLGLLVF